MTSNRTCVPHEFATTDNKRFPGHVSQPELKPQVPQMHDINARANNRHNQCQLSIHVDTRGPTSTRRNVQGKYVKEQGIDGQGNPTSQQQNSVQLLDEITARVQDAGPGLIIGSRLGEG